MKTILTFQVDKDLNKAILLAANKKGVPRSVILRYMVMQYLEKENIKYDKKLIA